MQCPYCADPDYIHYGTCRVVQRHRFQAYRRILQISSI